MVLCMTKQHEKTLSYGYTRYTHLNLYFGTTMLLLYVVYIYIYRSYSQKCILIIYTILLRFWGRSKRACAVWVYKQLSSSSSRTRICVTKSTTAIHTKPSEYFITSYITFLFSTKSTKISIYICWHFFVIFLKNCQVLKNIVQIKYHRMKIL